MSDEKIFRVKTKEGDSQSGYLEEKIWGSDYVTITEEEGASGKRLKIEIDAEAIGGSIVTGKAKVSASDVAAYLEDQFAAGDGIDVSSNGSIITISLDASLPDLNDVDDALSPGEKDILSYDNGTSLWKVLYTIETAFSGTATKVPLASAIKNLLQALYITDAANCGSGGNAIMYHEDNFDSSRIMIASDYGTIFTSNYPTPADLIDCVPAMRTDATTAGALVAAGENAWDRVAYGDLYIGSHEGEGQSSDHFVAAYLETLLQEDYISTEPVYIDVLFKDVGGIASETKVKAFPYYAKSADTDRTALTAIEKTISYSGADYSFSWQTFEIPTITSDSEPISLSVFFACLSNKGTFTDDGAHEAIIVQARIRYPKKTVQLRIADVIL